MTTRSGATGGRRARAEDLWAIVLAGGDGSRLRALTTGARGEPVPKQFCTVADGRSMLRRTLDRITPLVDDARQLVAVVASHRRWWERELARHPPENVVVQPRNRGTAPGILAPLLEVAWRAPDACVVVLPSDHHVEEESVLREAVATAVDAVTDGDDRLLLVGMTPDGPDFDYGFIVPLPARGGEAAVGVRAFVEKPPLGLSFTLRAQGALWNTFIMVARAGVMRSLYDASVPWLVAAHAAAAGSPEESDALYDRLPPCDFSRSVLERCVPRLAVLPVRPCGWSDMGTPDRVLRCFQSIGVPPDSPETAPAPGGGHHDDRPRLRHDAAEDQRLAQ